MDGDNTCSSAPWKRGVSRESCRSIISLFSRRLCQISWRFERFESDTMHSPAFLRVEGRVNGRKFAAPGLCNPTAPGKKREICRPSKRSFGLILLRVAVCSVGRKLTSSCLPARNKIRFSLSVSPSVFSSAVCFSSGGQSSRKDSLAILSYDRADFEKTEARTISETTQAYLFSCFAFSSSIPPVARDFDLRWQLIADRNEWPKPYTTNRRFHFEHVGTVSLDRNYWNVINLLFVLPTLFYLNILKTEEIWQFWGQKNSRRAWHVIPAQELKLIFNVVWSVTNWLERSQRDFRSSSFHQMRFIRVFWNAKKK